MQNVHTRANKVKLAVFDVDGVLTDGTLYLADNGDEMKAFNSLDGHGMRMLRESGVELAIITGRTSTPPLAAQGARAAQASAASRSGTSITR